MTLDEMKTLDRAYLIPREAAEVLGCAPYSINVWARQRPQDLGFPVCVMGTRVRIPRIPFIEFMEGRGT